MSCLMGLSVSSLEICGHVSQSLERGSVMVRGEARTSIFALVQRGTSTTMFRTVCCSLAYSGMSWKGETGTPSFSMKMRCSRVWAAPTLRAVYVGAMVCVLRVGWRCPASCCVREWVLLTVAGVVGLAGAEGRW
jgi:hypothetical protein